jgi:hypothetical protein
MNIYFFFKLKNNNFKKIKRRFHYIVFENSEQIYYTVLLMKILNLILYIIHSLPFENDLKEIFLNHFFENLF